MKTFFFFLLLYDLSIQSFCDGKFVSLAIRKIISDFYLVKSDRFDVITHGSDVRQLNVIVNDLVRLKFDEFFPFKLLQVCSGNETISVNQSSIMLFDTLVSYHDFHKRAVLGNSYPKQFNILVYIVDLDLKQSQSLRMNSKMFLYESFILHKHDYDSLALVTFEIFQQPKCRVSKLSELNSFSRLKKNWIKREFFREKLKNFNGCEVHATVYYPTQPSAEVEFDGEGKMTGVWGYAVDVSKQIQKNLNFSLVFNGRSLFTRKYYNESMEEDYFIQRASLRKLHSLGKVFMDRYFVTQTFITVDDIILVSRSEPYTQFEKMFLPFEIEVWIWLIISLCIAVVVILVVKLTPLKIREFIFGRHVSSPILNLA